MILKPKQTYICYRCPRCASATMGFVGEFSLSADLLKLKCECKESAMSIVRTKDDKVKLSVPCVFCNKNHTFVISQETFYERELLLLSCPYTNMDICFTGTQEKISAAVEQNSAELNALFTDLGYENLDDLLGDDRSAEDIVPDADVYDTIRFALAELHEDNAIECPCSSADYDIEFVAGGVRIFCRQCNAEYMLPITSAESARDFLDCRKLILK